MQQDASEFLAYLLDILHEDLNRADKLQNMQLKKENLRLRKQITFASKELEEDSLFEKQHLTEEDQEAKASEAWKEYLFNNRSIVVDLFQGQLKSTLECLRCGYVSLKFDSFMYLSVPIPVKEKSPTLEMCVKEFTREEILDGLDMWKCPRCKSFERARKKIDIWKLPSVLIVHLKRFEFTERRSGKINSLVHFPINNLDLAPYVSRMQKDKPLYDLFSVMNHEGLMGGGHYYSFTKHRNDQKWYYQNDENVGQVKRLDKIVNADAYILFYSKMSVDQFCRQTLRQPDLWPHIHQTKAVQPFQSNPKFSTIDDPQMIPDMKSLSLNHHRDKVQQRYKTTTPGSENHYYYNNEDLYQNPTEKQLSSGVNFTMQQINYQPSPMPQIKKSPNQEHAYTSAKLGETESSEQRPHKMHHLSSLQGLHTRSQLHATGSAILNSAQTLQGIGGGRGKLQPMVINSSNNNYTFNFISASQQQQPPQFN